MAVVASFAGAPVWLVEDLAIVSDTLQKGSAALIASLNGQSGLFWTEAVTAVIRCALLSSENITLTFLLRLTILLQVLPLFVLTIIIGLVDGLVRRDLRRFGAGHESGFVYHHAAYDCLQPGGNGAGVAGGTGFFVPVYILISGAIIIGSVVCITTGAFKKYL